jgi:predicted acyl esterase
MKPLNVEVPTIQLSEPRAGDGSGWQPLNPRTETLAKGWKGSRSEPIEEAILVEHDVAITFRDGIKLYCDIYRPAEAPARSTPALICWSPFGKKFDGVSSLKLMTPLEFGCS